MQIPIVDSPVALNGRWVLHATTFPFLADTRRSQVELRYAFDPRTPRRLHQETTWSIGGRVKTLTGTTRIDDNGALVWRGHGIRALLSSHWTYSVSSDGDLAVVGFAPTLLSVPGYHVLARRNVTDAVVRLRVDLESRSLGLPRSELPSLRWRNAD
ncbi:MAG: hypothetical protein ABWZ77_02805 [Naasia sp.]